MTPSVVGETLSIVIPCLNEAAVIVNSLNALQPLRLQGVEVIVVDGGSDDETLALAEPLADRVLLGPTGRSRQMNAGAEQATGDYLLFLHADTRLPETFKREQSGWLQADAPWGFFPVRLSGRHWLLRLIGWSMNQRSRLTGIATGDQCIFIRRDIWQALGGFADIPLMEDIELSRRLKPWRPYVASARVTTSSRRWQDNGIVATMLLMWWLRCRYYFGADPVDLKKRYS